MFHNAKMVGKHERIFVSLLKITLAPKTGPHPTVGWCKSPAVCVWVKSMIQGLLEQQSSSPGLTGSQAAIKSIHRGWR